MKIYLGIAAVLILLSMQLKLNQACFPFPKPPRPPVRIPIRVKVPKWANRGAQSASQAAGKFKNKVADLKNPTKVIDEVKQPLLGRSSSTSNTRYHRMENPLASSKSKSLNDLSKVSKNKKPEMRDDVSTLQQYYSK